MSTSLDDVFGDGPAAGEAPTNTPDPTPAEPTQAPVTEAPADDDDDADPPEGDPRSGPVVPRFAYENERRRRQDHKGRADRAETEAIAFKRERDERDARLAERDAEIARLRADRVEVRHAPPAPQHYDPGLPTDPVIAARSFALDAMEEGIRAQHGDAEVEAALASAMKREQDDPVFAAAFRQARVAERNPWRWIMAEHKRHAALTEIGDDPAAFRARIVAEERARWEAEATGRTPAAPPVNPAAGLTPSLATARGSAPRSAPAFTGPTPLENVFGG